MTKDDGRPHGAISSREQFEALVRENGREQKTPICYVVGGGIGRPILRPDLSVREYIWPLKIRYLYGLGPFVADVRGDENSIGDMNILPNSYNLNFAFSDRADADAYLAALTNNASQEDHHG